MKRFNLIEKELCISVEGLETAIQLSYKNALAVIKKALERNRKGSKHYRHYTDEVDNRKKWIVVSSLPDNIMNQVEVLYGNIAYCYYSEELVGEASNRVLPDDLPYFLIKKIELAKASDLAQVCGWMRLCTDGEDWWLPRFQQKLEFYKAATIVITEQRLYGLHVSHPSSLRNKIAAWRKHDRESLIHGQYGNQNALFIDDAQRTRILDLYASPLKPSYRTVAQLYNREAEEKGLPTVSHERVRQILAEPQNLQTASFIRHGAGTAKNQFERTIRRRRPSFPDALWVLDGTTVQLIYQDENGHPKSDLYVEIVTDANSRLVLGKAIGESETSTLVQAALRDASRSTGMLPYQLQYDNSGANKSMEAQQLMQKMARLAFPTAPYNGKSKIVEALYGRIEQHFLRFYDNFKGGNITSPSLNSKANPDHIRGLVKAGALPTKDQAIAQLRLAIETYNHTAWGEENLTPVERYKTQHEKRRKIDYLLMVELFWVRRRYMAAYTKDGLTIEVSGKRHTYEVERKKGVEDMEFRLQHLGDRFNICYDPENLETICLYDKDWRFIATANQKYEVAMAKADSQESDGSIIIESLQDRQAYMDRLRQLAKEAREDMAEQGYPLLDYQYVHKDALNRMEKEELDKLLEETAMGDVIQYEPVNIRRIKSLYENDEEADGSLIDPLK